MTENQSQPPRSSNHHRLFSWTMLLTLIAFLAFFGLLFLVWSLRDLLSPLLIALLLAYIFNPLVNWIHHHWHWPRPLILTVLLILLTTLLVGLGIWLVPIALRQISEFLNNLPDLIQHFLDILPGQSIPLHESIRQQLSEASEQPRKFLPILIQGTSKSLNILSTVFSTVTYTIIYIMLLVVFFVVFSLHLSDLGRWCKQFLPHSKKDNILAILHKINVAANTFLRVRLTVAIILSVMLSVGWALVGVPYWFLFGFASGLLSIIPYAAGLGWLAVLLVNVLELPPDAGANAMLYALLWPTIVYGLVQFIEGWFLTPYMQGDRLHINPFIVLFVVLAGGALAGLLGMLLAIPLTAAWQILFTDVIKPRLVTWARQS